jgi:archaemetzincin
VSMVCTVALGAVEENVESGIAVFLAAQFGVEVRRLAPIDAPGEALDPGRGQWSSVELLKTVLRVIPNGALKCVGLTECDLYIPMLSFLFGQAQLEGRAALVSLARLRQEFYGLPGDAELLMTRARKEVLHEVGHTLGLVHCPDRVCAMSLSTGLAQVDAKLDRYCAACESAARSRVAALKKERT